MQFQPQYNFYELLPSIYLLEVDGNCDLAMTFLRAQEFYESVNNDFRGQEFSLDQYKEWYKAQGKTDKFTYGQDWKGFNLPSHVIEQCYKTHTERLATDEFFLHINQICKDKSPQSYYLLGVRRGDTHTLDHEMAHGLFTTNSSYRLEMISAVNSVEPEIKKVMFKELHLLGYGENVWIDEAQAFWATGLHTRMQHQDMLRPQSSKFQKIFKSYQKEWTLPEPLISTMNELMILR